MRRLALCLLLACLAAPGLIGYGQAQSADAAAPQRAAEQREAQQKLDALRQRIAALTLEQQALADQRDSAARALREADQRIAAAQTDLRALDADLAAQEQEFERLQDEQASVQTRLSAQRDALAALLRASHAQGRHARLKLLLAQDHVDQLGRTLAYLDYFRDAQLRQVQQLLADLAELARARTAVEAQQARLGTARAAQQTALETLEGERAGRRKLLASLEQRHRDTRQRLTALGRDETALLALLERLQGIFADIPSAPAAALPFASLAGKLAPPHGGRLRTGFGRPLPDGRSSSGWLIEVKPGEEIRAIAHGRVAFADWMKGYGLIVIIDHGEGYMSLYAGNDALLRAAGDWVDAGEAIAAGGTSGGQSSPGLYFELRRHGSPIDPARWLRRR